MVKKGSEDDNLSSQTPDIRYNAYLWFLSGAGDWSFLLVNLLHTTFICLRVVAKKVISSFVAKFFLSEWIFKLMKNITRWDELYWLDFFLPSKISLRISLIFQGRRFSNSSGILLNKNVDATNTTLEAASGTLTKLTLKIYVFPGNISSRLVHAKLPKSELKKWGDVQIDRRWVSQSVQSRIVRTEQVINQSDFSTFQKRMNPLGIELVGVRKHGSQQKIQ